MLIDTDDIDLSDYLNHKDLPIQLQTKIVAEVIQRVAARQIKIEEFYALDKLCTPYEESKSTRVVRRNKSMTATKKN